ncbi:MAG TPA: Nramp family divalent metal transporter [Terriglobales bacterium]|nr:Nramp family divalent metal transporter [Terriglobales bacterium]
MRWLKLWKTRILLFFAVVGPGFITSNVDNDAGGIYTYSFAGARYGYQLLWTIVPMIIALVVIQEMAARMGAVTGKGLSDLVREEFGLRLTFLMMLALVVTNFGNVVAEFAGVASSLELFDVPKWISVPGAALLVWLLVVKGTYKSVEKIFLVAVFFYVAYIGAAVLSRPHWLEALVSTVPRPTRMPFTDAGYLYMVTAMIGATIAPWQMFYLQASVVEKGVTVRTYKLARIDVIVGAIVAPIVAGFIVIACAALYQAGHTEIHDAADAAYALRPLAGKYASILFAFGLFNASLFAASILPLSTAYTVCEGLGLESGIDKKFSEAPAFYWLYTALIVAGAGVILWPDFPLLKITVLSQVVNGVLLPFVLFFMIKLVNKKDLMGNHVNSRLYNGVAWVTAGGTALLTLVLVWMS